MVTALTVLPLMAAQVLVRIVDRGVLGVPEHPTIVRFRKGDRKRKRQSITTGNPGFEKINTALLVIDSRH
jgi:hypothetical protein